MIDENTTETESFESSDSGLSTDEPTVVEKVSLEDSIRSAFNEAKSDKPEEDKEAQKPIQERNRAKDGKFKKGKVKSYEFNQETKTVSDTSGQSQSPAESKEQAEVEPIHYWTVETKEWFNKQQPEYKRQLLKEAKEREAHTTKLWQNLQRQNQRYSGIDQVISHYAPKWHAKGFDEVTALRQLAAHYQDLEENPENAIVNVMSQKGITLEQLAQYVQNGGQIRTSNSNAPEDSVLRKELNELKDYIRGAQEYQNQQVVNSAIQEINALRNEKFPDGRYKHPKLWDTQYLQRVQPLVEQVRQTYPGVTWKDATLKAHNALLAMDGEAQVIGSPSPNGTKLSQTQELQKAKQASVSVRSRGSAQITAPVHKPKPKERIEDSIRASMAQLDTQNRF